jgi:transposase-like protein
MSQKQSILNKQNGDRPPDQPDPEVMPRARRRTFSATYKVRILAEADACTERGEIGALLRREGLYSSHLSNWRRQREAGQLQSLKNKPRGRKPALDAKAAEVARLEQENARLQQQLAQAELIITAQKKLAEALEKTLTSNEDGN